MKAVRLVLAIVVAAAFFYLLFAIITAEWNLMEWHWAVRLIYAVILMLNIGNAINDE